MLEKAPPYHVVRPSRFLVATALFAALASAQSLEERVNQARKLQAMSASGAEEMALDSLLKEKRRARLGAGAPAPAPGLDPGYDSLIAGPGEPWSLSGPRMDTAGFSLDTATDSLSARRRAARRLPKRFEQRIFLSVDRTAFSSARGAVGRDHVLGPGDGIIVSLWGDKEREYDLTLNAEGRVFLEGVGLVPLAGLNLNEAQAALKIKLARIYSGINRGTAFVDVSVGRAGPVKVFVLGEVKVPGGYVFTGNTGVLSALYFARGPTDIGTVRDLRLTRGGKSQSIDLYQFLVRGASISPAILREGDILFAGRAHALVEISGDVGRPAVYELRKGEGVRELLEFAGSLNPTAAPQKMTLQRIGGTGAPDYLDLADPRDYLTGKATMELKDGDRVLVEKSTELGRNFITVMGPVKYPGTYSASGVTTIRDVIGKAGGLSEDAFLGRAHILRFKPDGSSQLFAYSLDTSYADTIQLQPRDNVILYSLKDMLLPDSVEISGAVFNPGRYEFREGMTPKDLVMQAGGFLPQHEVGRILLFRGGSLDRKVEHIDLKVEKGLEKTSEGTLLKARDFIQVPIDPRWYTKEIVTLEGLFVRPGKYALLHPGEKVSSVIARAGGFKPDAYIQGGRFFRTRDSVGRIGVNVDRAVARPRSKANIAMVGGDSVFIPAKVSTVKVIGEVGFETSVMWKEGEPVAYYIDRAGGFTRRSENDRIVVQFANGETGRAGYFHRKPDAGSVIYVPQGPEPVPVDWVGSINALLGTIGVAAALILSIQAIQSN